MAKEARRYFDGQRTWIVNLRTRIVRDSATGDFAEPGQAERIVWRVAGRVRSQRTARDRDEAMRSLGLVKVRGAVSGRTYWE